MSSSLLLPREAPRGRHELIPRQRSRTISYLVLPREMPRGRQEPIPHQRSGMISSLLLPREAPRGRHELIPRQRSRTISYLVLPREMPRGQQEPIPHQRSGTISSSPLPREVDRPTWEELSLPKANKRVSHPPLPHWSAWNKCQGSPAQEAFPRVINLQFPLNPHQKYYITQYEELGFS